MEKKKVCLTTWHTSLNYGTCIQAYSLAEFLRKNDCDVYIPDSFRYYYGLNHPIETMSNVLSKVKHREKAITISDEIKEKYDRRYKKNAEFARKMSGVISFSSREEYNKIKNGTDFFISGSDQIWNPDYVTPPMLLSFASNDKRKMAYGSSIGVMTIPEKKKKLYRKYLFDFERIGVRESSAKKVLSEFVDESKIEVVLDPTFLLDRNDWEKIAEKPKGLLDNDEFVFCYFIGENEQWIRDLEKYVKNNPIEALCIPSEAMIIPRGVNCMVDGGVREFVWCLLHAKYILTDSFHAVALSINFGQKFIVYKRFADSDKRSQNSRIISVLEQFGLKQCLKDDNKSLDFISKDVEYISDKLDRLRNESMDFLIEGLR